MHLNMSSGKIAIPIIMHRFRVLLWISNYPCTGLFNWRKGNHMTVQVPAHAFAPRKSNTQQDCVYILWDILNTFPSVAHMITSSNKNIFCVTSSLCGEFTGPRWTSQKPGHKSQWSGALVFCLICAWAKNRLNNRCAGDLRRYRTHYMTSL